MKRRVQRLPTYIYIYIYKPDQPSKGSQPAAREREASDVGSYQQAASLAEKEPRGGGVWRILWAGLPYYTSWQMFPAPRRRIYIYRARSRTRATAFHWRKTTRRPRTTLYIYVLDVFFFFCYLPRVVSYTRIDMRYGFLYRCTKREFLINILMCRKG